MTDQKRTEEFAAGKERVEEIGRRLGNLFGKKPSPDGGGFFSGLGSLIEQLGVLAEEAEKAGGVVHKSGSFNFGPGRQNKGVYGFTVKSAQGDKPPQVESFGNIRRDDAGKLVEVQEIREPIVDVFDEADRVLVVAELPGIEEKNLHIEISGDILLISSEEVEPKYRKELLLPSSFTADKMSFKCRNGVLEIQLLKDGTVPS